MIIGSISTVYAQSTPTPAPSLTPTPSPTATPTANATETPTPTPEPFYNVGIEVINGNTTLKQATVVIDDEPKTTGFTGTAEFKCQAGLHVIQIYYDNQGYYNSSLVTMDKPQVIPIDITAYLPQHTPAPTVEGNFTETDGTYTGFGLVIIAVTGVCLTIILIKKRS